MIIRKMYKFEAAHIVRNCASKRCSKSIHGHSYLVEFLLKSEQLDAGGMVLDFGLLKANLGDFADSFDHALMVWHDDAVMLDAAYHTSDRVVASPYNMTAENMAKVFYMGAEGIIAAAQFQNGEGNVTVESVIVHETATGYAQAFAEDIHEKDRERMQQLQFTPAIQADWKDKDLGHYAVDGLSGVWQFDLPIEV